MKKTIVAGLFALLCLVAAPSARSAENWCLRNFGDPPGKGCVSAPLQYCLRGLAAASALVTGAISTKVMIAIGRSAPRGVPGRSAGTGSGV